MRDVAGEGRQQGAVGPAQPQGLLGRAAGEQAVDQPGGEAVAAADAVRARRAGIVGLTYCWPSSHSTAAQSWRLVECTSRSVVATSLMFGYCCDDALDQLEEGVGIELRAWPCTSGPGDAQALLQVFLVADQGIDVADDAADDLLGRAASPPTDGPELGAIVQVEGVRRRRRPARPACLR